MDNITKDVLSGIWKDSVWSKVIAVIIVAIGGYLFAYSDSILYKVGYAATIIVFLIAYVIYKRNQLKIDIASSMVLVDIHKPNNHQLEGAEAKLWDDIKKQEYGEKGDGEFNIENGILNIHRFNTDGRYIVRFLSYIINGKKQLFIDNKDYSTDYMRLYVTFSAKVIKGAHTFRVVCRSYQNNTWIAGASFSTFRINNSQYTRKSFEMKVPVGEDFRIQVDVLGNENADSSILIKDFRVEKFISN